MKIPAGFASGSSELRGRRIIVHAPPRVYLTRHSKSDGIQDAAENRVVDTAQRFELLAQLPPRQRAAIVLRFYEDLPYDQIASELGVSVGTVKAQVSTGLQRLRINLGNEDPEP